MINRRAEVEKRVYEKYPETEEEKKCAQEKRKREYQRTLLRKRLKSEIKEKREYGRSDY
jgi:hypothetical protein